MTQGNEVSVDSTPSATGSGASSKGAQPRTFTALVCAYTMERWPQILEAVSSLQHQTRPVDQLILVVDHNPELLDRARNTFTGVTVAPNAGQRGLSDARNTGIHAATGEVIGFLDDDATAAPDWAERMLECYGDPGVLGVGGHVAPAWPQEAPAWFPPEFLWVVGCSYVGLPTQRSEIRNPIGANMSFRRSVLTEVGGFSTLIGRLGEDAAGCEETELSIRALTRHPTSRVVMEPAARCEHKVSVDRLTRNYFRRRCTAEGRSKALVSRLTGPQTALSSERDYVIKTLPHAMARGVRRLATGDVDGIRQALAILEGLTLTIGAYAWTLIRAEITGAHGSRSLA